MAVDSGGSSQAPRIRQDKMTVSAELNKHLYPKSRAELLLLHGTLSKVAVVSCLPPNTDQEVVRVSGVGPH